MKRTIMILMIAFILLLSGCKKQVAETKISADGIRIGYGFSSYAMFEAEHSIIEDLLTRINSLTFEETADSLDLATAFSVDISLKGEGVKSIWVDSKGVFWLDGGVKCYRVKTGEFDYQYLKTIYEGGNRY